MAEDPSPVDEIAFLARSETRVRTLKVLLERDGATQPACRECLDASRSTVARTLSALEDRGWIERDGRTYRLTPAGEIVAESFLELVDTVRATEECSTFLRWFPHEAFDLDLAAVRDAELTTSSPSDPYAPADRQTELLRRASRMRCLMPSIEIEGSRMVHERCLDGDLEMESVLSPGVAETATGGEYAPLFREMVETGAHDLFVADDELPFYLGLTDDDVQVGVEDDEGFPRALLVSDDADVREWAESVYARRRERAEPLTPADFDAAAADD